jgi:hypothetical protein
MTLHLRCSDGVMGHGSWLKELNKATMEVALRSLSERRETRSARSEPFGATFGSFRKLDDAVEIGRGRQKNVASFLVKC